MSEITPQGEPNARAAELSKVWAPQQFDVDAQLKIDLENLKLHDERLRQLWRNEADYLLELRPGENLLYHVGKGFSSATAVDTVELGMILQRNGKRVPGIRVDFQPANSEEIDTWLFDLGQLVDIWYHPSRGPHIAWNLRGVFARGKDRTALFDHVSQYGKPITGDKIDSQLVTSWPGYTHALTDYWD